MVPGRGAVAATAVIALVVCGAAAADNYRFQRTAGDDATAAAIALKRADLPSQLRLSGGRTKPDEKPDNTSCFGYHPKESDLVVTGDAETRYANTGAGIATIGSQVELLKTPAMVATDYRRALPMLSARCGSTVAKQEHLHLVGAWLELGPAACTCDESASFSFETATARKDRRLVWVLTVMRRGRVEVSIGTALVKATNDTGTAAIRDALAIQGLAVKAISARLARFG